MRAIRKIISRIRRVFSMFRRIKSYQKRLKKYPSRTLLIVVCLVVIGVAIYFAIKFLINGVYWPIIVLSVLLIVPLIVYFLIILNRNAKERNVKQISVEEEDVSPENLKQVYKNIGRFFKRKKKNIVNVPLVMTVGEQGSGKSSLINNSSLHFIDSETIGKGESESKNLKWYVSSDAIIVDVKGENLFNKNNKLFNKLLRLLSQKRRDIPVNNIILTISAKELILNDEEKIKKDALAIWSVLEKIKRVTKVKPPIYVLITKCDVINGFEEFFLSTSSLDSNEILGFDISSTEELELDSSIDASIKSFVDNIYTRRSGLLNSTQIADSKTLSKIYNYPREIDSVIRKLKNYISTILLESKLRGDELPFLRGIYFASALQEKDNLASPVADTFFSNVTTLKREEKAIPQKSKSLFVYDLFLKKIVQEKELVLQMTKRVFLKRCFLYGFNIAVGISFCVVMALMFIGRNDLKQKLVKESPLWERAAQYEASFPILLEQSNGTYLFNTKKKVASLQASKFIYNLSKLTKFPLKISFAFTPALLVNDVNRQRKQKAREIFEGNLINSLFAGITEKLALTPSDKTSEEDIKILMDLLHLRLVCLGSDYSWSKGSSCYSHHINLDLWFRYLLDNPHNKKAWASYLESIGNNPKESIYQETFNNLYHGADSIWPPAYCCSVLNRFHVELESKEYTELLYSLHDFENYINEELADVEETIPNVPFTWLRSKELDANYSPQKMAMIINKWKVLNEEYNEAKEIMNKNMVNDAWNKADSIYKKYIINYQRYWDSLLKDAGASVLPWKYYQRDIVEQQAWLINRKLKSFYNVALKAMEKLLLAYEKESVPENITVRIQLLKNSISQLNDGTFNQQTGKILNYWRETLGDSALEARNEIFKRSCNEFLDSAVLPVDKSNPSYFAQYWHDLGYSFLDSLSDAVQQAVTERMNEIVKNAKYPFSPQNTYDNMTKEECISLIDELDILTADQKLYFDDEFGNLSGEELTKLGPQLSVRMKNLRFKLALPFIDWINNAKVLFNVLETNSFNFSTKIDLEGLDENISDNMGSYVWPAIRFKQTGNDGKFPVVLTRTSKNAFMGNVICPGGNLVLDFYKNSAEISKDTPDIVGEIPGNWSVISFLIAGPKRLSNFKQEFWFSWKPAIYIKETTTWKTEVIMTSLKGEKLYFYILFKAPEELACIKNWASIVRNIQKQKNKRVG